MHKENWAHIAMEKYSVFKKMEILSFATKWINLEDIISGPNKQRKARHNLIHMTRIKKWTVSQRKREVGRIWEELDRGTIASYFVWKTHNKIVVMGISLVNKLHR